MMSSTACGNCGHPMHWAVCNVWTESKLSTSIDTLQGYGSCPCRNDQALIDPPLAVPTPEPVLCYVSGCAAFFTTQPLDKQWGDDWDDAPYEHNAGTPYGWRDTVYDRDVQHLVPNTAPRWDVIEVHWGADLEAPADRSINSRYSVRDINEGRVPWLRTQPWRKVGSQVSIMAGTTLSAFKRIIWAEGGRIWEETDPELLDELEL